MVLIIGSFACYYVIASTGISWDISHYLMDSHNNEILEILILSNISHTFTIQIYSYLVKSCFNLTLLFDCVSQLVVCIGGLLQHVKLPFSPHRSPHCSPHSSPHKCLASQLAHQFIVSCTTDQSLLLHS